MLESRRIRKKEKMNKEIAVLNLVNRTKLVCDTIGPYGQFQVDKLKDYRNTYCVFSCIIARMLER